MAQNNKQNGFNPEKSGQKSAARDDLFYSTFDSYGFDEFDLFGTAPETAEKKKTPESPQEPGQTAYKDSFEAFYAAAGTKQQETKAGRRTADKPEKQPPEPAKPAEKAAAASAEDKAKAKKSHRESSGEDSSIISLIEPESAAPKTKKGGGDGAARRPKQEKYTPEKKTAAAEKPVRSPKKEKTPAAEEESPVDSSSVIFGWIGQTKSGLSERVKNLRSSIEERKAKDTAEEKPAPERKKTPREKPAGEQALQSRQSAYPENAPTPRQRIGRSPRRGELLVYDSELEQADYDEPDDLPETRDYLPVRFRRYGRSGIGGGLMYAAFVISISVILACVGWLFAADVLALSKDEVSASVVVEPYIPGDDDILNADGDPVDEEGNVITCDPSQVAAALKDNGIIEYKFLFELFSKLSHAYYKIDPGTYDVSTTLDYRALVTEMQTGSESQEVTRITFPEGYSMDQIFRLLDENNICDLEDLYDAAANHDYAYSWLEEDWYLDAKGDPTRLEGYLFPDTYDFYQGESAVNTINRLLLRFHSILTQDMYQQAENEGITLHEAVIMASLIEKEAGANDDRGNFSSVIYNRLRNGWLLQLDSTINYIQNTSTFNLSYADLETDSPYNTYLYAGLPKGAICNPGLASLTAAFQPNSTDYWYWYAVDGETYFFTNQSDFNSFADAHPY